ncbi:MAG: amidohydrolase family protein [Acetobacteraceae bacterium]|nr:amidohydrolase family protein [Acetobacteraceae bacterium]
MTDLVVDGHCHVGSLRSTPFIRLDTAGLLAKMNQNGVDRAVVTDLSGGVEGTSRAVREAQGRLWGFALLDPWDPEAPEVLERAVTREGFMGLKLHPGIHGFFANAAVVDPLLRAAQRLDVPVYVHSGTPPHSLPLQIADLAERFPGCAIIMGHMGLYPSLWIDALRAAEKAPNVFLETSCMPVYRVIERAVELVGADRVIFGSDEPYGLMAAELSKIRGLRVSEREKDFILGGTLMGLLQGRAGAH